MLIRPVCLNSFLDDQVYHEPTTNTMYFHALGMTRAKNFLFESVTCLYSNPFTCRKRSASCLGDFPFDSHLEICLQNGSVFCICRSACNLSMVSGFWFSTCCVNDIWCNNI